MSVPSIYPSTPLDRPELFKTYLGSFWSDAYADQAELDATLAGTAIPWRQAAITLDEAVAAACYETIPPLRTREWVPVVVYESGRLDARYTGLRYDPASAARFGAAGRFGDAGATPGFPAPLAGIVDAPMIFNAVHEPTVALVAGLDYTIDATRGVFLLAVDPFADPRWAPVPLYGTDGAQTDRQVTLWVWRAKFDERDVHRRIGYAMGVRAPSTEVGRDFVNAIVDAVVQGTSEYTIRRFFSALCDVPICRNDREVVERIFRDDLGLAIVTDKAVHRAAAGAAPVVIEGDVLELGDCPVDALRFDPLNTGVAPPDLPFLAVGPGLLPAGLGGLVAFFDEDSPLLAEDAVDADGAPLPCRVTWRLGGSPAAQTAFWNEVRRGEARDGATLSELLDPRPAPVDPPRAVDMPPSINGLEFLLGNLLRGCAYLVRIRTEGCGPGRLDSAFMQTLRRLLPPHLVLLVQVQTPLLSDGAAPGPDASPPSAVFLASTASSPSPPPPAADALAAEPAPEYTP